jgi:hypothetical protein
MIKESSGVPPYESWPEEARKAREQARIKDPEFARDMAEDEDKHRSGVRSMIPGSKRRGKNAAENEFFRGSKEGRLILREDVPKDVESVIDRYKEQYNDNRNNGSLIENSLQVFKADEDENSVFYVYGKLDIYRGGDQHPKNIKRQLAIRIVKNIDGSVIDDSNVWG